MSKPTLAVAMIVKNEARQLSACLSSIQGWVDEIVVVDGGSQDATCEIARGFGAKVFVHEQWPGFGLQRQLAQQYVSSEYILWLDADERVTPELKAAILHALAERPQSTVFSIPRLSYAFGRFIRHSGWYPDRVLRLYPTHLTGYNSNLVHEKVVLDDSMHVISLKGDLLHYTYESLEHYLVKSASYATAWAQQRQLRGKKGGLIQGLGHGLGCFLRMYVLKAGFLDGPQGFLLALLSAHSTFVKYADLWLRSNAQSAKDPSPRRPEQD